MAKTPKKDINLYTLVIGPKKSTMKKGVLFAVIGIVSVVLLSGSYVGVRFYVKMQEKVVSELEEKANDSELLAKIQNANAVAADIGTMRTAGQAYAQVRTEIDSSQRYCDDFSPDLIQKLTSCEYYSLLGERVRIAAITNISYDGTVMEITATSPDSHYISYFVDSLNRLKLFSDISYTGYTLSGEEYTFTINAVFQEHVYETTEEEGAQTENDN